jgi:hypothetical protein
VQVHHQPDIRTAEGELAGDDLVAVVDRDVPSGLIGVTTDPLTGQKKTVAPLGRTEHTHGHAAVTAVLR